jgi:hypothetical protein
MAGRENLNLPLLDPSYSYLGAGALGSFCDGTITKFGAFPSISPSEFLDVA